jgi:hypothetical protein
MSPVPAAEPAKSTAVGWPGLRRAGSAPRAAAPSRASRRHGRAIAPVLGLSLWLALAASVALAAAGTMKTVTASSGATSATVTYLLNSNSAAGPPFADVHLSITRDGSSAFDAAVSAPCAAPHAGRTPTRDTPS